MRDRAQLALTPLGEEVLRGRSDWLVRMAQLGQAEIDRWLGGVHLTDPTATWRWDPAHRKLRRPG